MRVEVSYIPYATLSHEQTRKIITFAQSEEGNLVENERNTEEDESISSWNDELSTDYDCSDGPISTNTLEEISNGSQII